MKAKIDKDACTGCGLCADTCPDVFESGNDVATVKVEEIPASAVECAKQAADECPAEAIKIE